MNSSCCRLLEESQGQPTISPGTALHERKVSKGSQCFGISDIIRRAGNLSPAARLRLEALSVAGAPLSRVTRFRAAKATDEDPSRILWLLNVSFEFTGGVEAKLEPFHD